MAVIVLTSAMQFWEERSLRDAIKLHFRGKIEILCADESRYIRAGISRDGGVFKMPVPLVVRLTNNFTGFKIKSDTFKCSDSAVFNRDQNVCQYWHHDERGKRYKHVCSEEERTIDHVVPKSRGGGNGFDNKVTCCSWHNIKVKKNRTPEEAGMELIRQPQPPKLKKGDMMVMTFTFNPNKQAHKAYKDWLETAFA